MSFRRATGVRTCLVLWLSAACSDLLGLEQPSSSEAEAVAGRGGSGHSGHSGTGMISGAGAPAGGAGASFAGEAGTGAAGDGGDPSSGGDAGASSDAGQSGASAAGGSLGGDAGAAAGLGGTPGDDAAGQGGEGDGGAPVFEWPTPGGPCALEGALACRAPDSTTRYLCDGGKWIDALACDIALERCDRRSGACSPNACQGKEPGEVVFCGIGNLEALVCGPDRVTLESVVCAVRCDYGVGCVDLSPGQLVLERVETTVLEGRLWPNPLIPVCFRGAEPDEATLAARAAVRLAVDTSWGRHGGASFVGWDDCGGESEGVEIGFVDDCQGELDRIPRPGYPGNGQSLPVELCTSYLDAEGTRHPAPGQPIDLSLLSFVAQHVFGHVLGREDQYYDPPLQQLMTRTLDLDVYSTIRLNYVDIEILGNQYGSKPSHAFLAPNGRCLGVSSGEFRSEACDGSFTQQFQPMPSGLVHVETDSCVRLDGESVSAETCTGDAAQEAFVPSRVRWIGPKGRCVSVRATPDEEGPLDTQLCDPLWPENQTFAFEFLSEDSVRIRTATGSCVRWPEAWDQNAVPELGDCDGTRDVFEIWGGRLSHAGQCLHSPSHDLGFSPCGEFVDQRFYLSGSFELDETALALLGTGDDAELSTSPVTFPPSPETVFDYHF